MIGKLQRNRCAGINYLSWRKQRGLTLKNIIKTSKYDRILAEFSDRISELYHSGKPDHDNRKFLKFLKLQLKDGDIEIDYPVD